MAAVTEHVTRRYAGHGEDGQPRYDVTWHGRARSPQSVAEWAGQRVAALGYEGTRPAGRVVVGLLTADGAGAVRAVVAGAAGLDEYQRHAVLACLRACRGAASESYGQALGHMDGLIAAWVKVHGDREPKPRAAHDFPRHRAA